MIDFDRPLRVVRLKRCPERFDLSSSDFHIFPLVVRILVLSIDVIFRRQTSTFGQVLFELYSIPFQLSSVCNLLLYFIISLVTSTVDMASLESVMFVCGRSSELLITRSAAWA